MTCRARHARRLNRATSRIAGSNPRDLLTRPDNTERQLIADARDRGWDREIERHQRTADRITSLLDDLGEPHDEPTD
ncbi:hypothetical protein GCM10022420_013340 [Streptomyces iranensis]|nr:predicted protein [Streptomyces iranensis]